MLHAANTTVKLGPDVASRCFEQAMRVAPVSPAAYEAAAGVYEAGGLGEAAAPFREASSRFARRDVG